MFYDYDEVTREEAHNLLELFDLNELLEMNDISDIEVLTILILKGLIDTYKDSRDVNEGDE